MMAKQEKATGHFAGAMPGANDGSTSVRGVSETPPTTLAQAGIDKNLAKRARTLERLTDEEFEHKVKEARKVCSTTELVNRPVKPLIEDIVSIAAYLDAIGGDLHKYKPADLAVLKRAVAKLSKRLNESEGNVTWLSSR